MEPTIRLNGVILRWPAVYEKTTAIPDQLPARHSVSFAADEELIAQLGEHGIAPKFNEGQEGFFFHAKSGIAPIVTPKGGDFDALVRAVQIAAARNIPLDKLLRDLPTDIRVTFYEYSFKKGHSGRGMAVKEVIADEAAMLRIATDVTGE